MGKPNSYLFCRMHDMKPVFFNAETGEFQFVTLSISLPAVLEKFTRNNPEFSKNDAVLALCSLLCLDNDTRYTQYQHYATSYGGDIGDVMEEILRQNDELDALLEANPCDTTIIYLMALCLGVCARNSPDAMAGAHGLMNRVLDMEEKNLINVDDELTPWVTLANFLNFEEAHDRSFGSPIIGNSQYYQKDKNGNPVNKESNNSSPSTISSSQSTSSGGCYVATAVYGSYDCPQVWTLRRYRDYDLDRHWYGRAFIRLYYAVSPTVVSCFGTTKWFNKVWRKLLDKMVNNLKDRGYSSSPYEDKNW